MSDTKENDSLTDSDLNELLFDDFEDEKNKKSANDEILDIQKELEAKFDELFGPMNENQD